MQYTLGGPIIAFQIENEYGWFGSDLDYLKMLKSVSLPDSGHESWTFL